jgi:hypothetical protein
VSPAGAWKVAEIGLMGSANNNNNSILTYVRLKSTVKWTITKLPQGRRKKQQENTNKTQNKAVYIIIIIIIVIMRMKRTGHVARTKEKRNSYRVLVGKPEGKRPLGRPRRRMEVNNKTDVTEIGWAGMDRIQDRDQRRALVNTVTSFQVA